MAAALEQLAASSSFIGRSRRAAIVSSTFTGPRCASSLSPEALVEHGEDRWERAAIDSVGDAGGAAAVRTRRRVRDPRRSIPSAGAIENRATHGRREDSREHCDGHAAKLRAAAGPDEETARRVRVGRAGARGDAERVLSGADCEHSVRFAGDAARSGASLVAQLQRVERQVARFRAELQLDAIGQQVLSISAFAPAPDLPRPGDDVHPSGSMHRGPPESSKSCS